MTHNQCFASSEMAYVVVTGPNTDGDRASRPRS
jgi:hypothetical protein